MIELSDPDTRHCPPQHTKWIGVGKEQRAAASPMLERLFQSP